jgi:hypothetical protein
MGVARERGALSFGDDEQGLVSVVGALLGDVEASFRRWSRRVCRARPAGTGRAAAARSRKFAPRVIEINQGADVSRETN